MKPRRIHNKRRNSTTLPTLLLGFLLTLFLVAFAYAAYLFVVWGQSVASRVPEMPELELPKLVRSAPPPEPITGEPTSAVVAQRPLPTPTLEPLNDGRTTVLVMGVDNRPGEPIARTDTIILLTLDHETGKAGMLSLPRDLVVYVPTLGRVVKINTVHVLGEVNQMPDGGPGLLRDTVENLIGYPIDYYVRVNFDGFRRIIDLIGGVDIDVEKTIRDDLYPDENYGYDPLYIPAGRRHMDGDLALKYARVRNVDSDYGRAHRQQQVILAVKDRLSKPGQLAALLPRLPRLALTLAVSVQTDMPIDRALALARRIDQFDLDHPTQIVVDNTMGVDFSDPKLGYILTVDQSKLRDAADMLFAGADGEQLAANRTQGGLASSAIPPAHLARIVVLNGSPDESLATNAASSLTNQGFNIVQVGSADRTDYTESWLITHDERAVAARAALATRFGITGEHVTTQPASSDADLTLILGIDQFPPTPTPIMPGEDITGTVEPLLAAEQVTLTPSP